MLSSFLPRFCNLTFGIMHAIKRGEKELVSSQIYTLELKVSFRACRADLQKHYYIAGSKKWSRSARDTALVYLYGVARSSFAHCYQAITNTRQARYPPLPFSSSRGSLAYRLYSYFLRREAVGEYVFSPSPFAKMTCQEFPKRGEEGFRQGWNGTLF